MQKKHSIFFFFLTLLFCYPVALFSQQIYPLNNENFYAAEKCLNSINSNAHTSFKPLTGNYVARFTNSDSLTLLYRPHKPKRYILRKLRYEHFVIIDSNDFHLTIDPLVNLEIGKQNNKTDLFNNTRGVWLQGAIGKKISFQSDFYENQSVFDSHLTEYISKSKVVPGQGNPKNFKKTGWDYASASGIVSVTPDKNFNLQFGHGKNFIGDGYRSLLLSDNAFNYPFFKITTTVWKIQYTNLYASFLDLNAPHEYEQGYRKKFGTFHFLNWNATKRLQIGFFESVIWQNYQDSIGNKRGFDFNYLNPIIFYWHVQFALGSPDNSLLGMNAKFKITDKAYFYGQLILDDFDLKGMSKGKGYILEKFGFQLGFKAFDLLKVNNLYFQTEVNQVQPYVYAHKSPGQNYSHYNEALAHPLGANFIESVSILRYQIKDFIVENKINYTLYGADSISTNPKIATHWGHDIFKPDWDAQLGFPSWGNKLLQGIKTALIYNDFKISYLVNPNTNAKISVGIINRIEKSSQTNKNYMIIYIGYRTALSNLYYDF